MALTSKLTVSALAEQVPTLDLAAGKVTVNYAKVLALTSGVGVDQADLLWQDQRTLAASGTEDLDLAGVLTDAFGAVLTFARVKGLIVAAAAGNTNNVVVGGAATNAWATLLGATGTLTVRPSAVVGVFCPTATGYPVTTGTGDLLKVANSGAGTPVTYDIVVIGASA